MPLINWISTLHIDGETDEELIKVANQRINSIQDLEFVINEKPFKVDFGNSRFSSGIFEAVLPDDNILDATPGTTGIGCSQY
jgi:hypothetical protein